jgi:hypothetical protein
MACGHRDREDEEEAKMRWNVSGWLRAIALLTVTFVSLEARAAGRIYLSSSDGNNQFHRYDIATNTWTTLRGYSTYAEFAVSPGGVLFAVATNGQIQQYNEANDTWSNVGVSTPISGDKGALQIDAQGRFWYHQVNQPNVYYYENGQWSSINVGTARGHRAELDPASGLLFVSRLYSLGGVLIDTNTKQVVGHNDFGSNWEWARFSSIVGQYLYAQASGDIWRFDLSNWSAAPVNMGHSIETFYPEATADRAGKFLYSVALGGGTFERFDLNTNTWSVLASSPGVGNHSIMAYVPEPATIGLLLAGGLILLRRR